MPAEAPHLATPASLIVLSALFPAAVAALTLWLAVAVLLGDPRRDWNRWLALFLLLVAGNFATQAYDLFSSATQVAGFRGALASQAGADAAKVVGGVLGALDPGVLARFATEFPRRPSVRARRASQAALLAGVAFAVLQATTGALNQGTGSPARLLFYVYFAGCYLYACRRVLRAFLAERSDAMALQVRAVLAGLLAAILPRLALLTLDIQWDLDLGLPGAPPFVELALRLIVLLALAALVARTVAKAPAEARRREEARAGAPALWRWYALLACLWLVGRMGSGLVSVGVDPGESFLAFSQAADSALVYSARWFAFAFAISRAAVADGILDVDGRLLMVAGLGTAPLAGFVVVAGIGGFFGPLLAGGVAAALLAGGAAFGATRLRRHAPPPLPPPPQDDRFDAIRTLGVGGQATAHLAVDRRDGRQVVVKRFLVDAAGAEAAAREIAVARRASSPHLVAIHDAFASPGEYVVVMEHCERGSLRDALRRGALPRREALRVLDEVLLGLHALHAGGVVHGDLKPENVLLAAGGSVRLADFGLARVLGERTRVHASGGTPGYVAPEVAQGGPPTVASDLYAAAVMAREMLGGDARPWQEFFRRALATRPAQRFQSAREMRAAVPLEASA